MGVGERREASDNEPARSHRSSLLPAFRKRVYFYTFELRRCRQKLAKLRFLYTPGEKEF